MFRSAFLNFLPVVAISLLAACGGDDTTTTVRTSEPQPESEPTLAQSSGDQSLDKVLIEALAKDEIELAGLTGYQRRPCGPIGEAGEEPECREAETPGTEVEVLAGSSCANAWVRPETVPDAFRLSLAPDQPELLAVYRPNYAEGTFGGGFGATAVAVFATGSREDGTPKGVSMHVLDGRVVWLQNDCANVSELLSPDRISAFIIEPTAP